jgi:hypothetical protein
MEGVWTIDYMPRFASRLTLEVTGVKVERLHDIREEDAREEGVEVRGVTFHPCSHILEFGNLWNSIHGSGAWEENPFIYALTFKVHKCNIEELEK